MNHTTVFATADTTGDVLGVGCFKAEDRLRVVAVRGSANDWAAYADYETYHEARIATHGLKLEQATAVLLFPDVEMNYRR